MASSSPATSTTPALEDAQQVPILIDGPPSGRYLAGPGGEEASSSRVDAHSMDEKPTTASSPASSLRHGRRGAPSATETTLVPPPRQGDSSTSDSADPILTHLMPYSGGDELAPIASASSPPPSVRVQKPLNITLVFISGIRHSFTINAEYLSRHNIEVSDQDPLLIGVSTLKECIWREWKDQDWDVKPPSSNFIRLIYFGKLLEDRLQLKECKLNCDGPNFLHTTVRPAEIGDDDQTQRSTKLPFGREREHRADSSPGCRCVIL